MAYISYLCERCIYKKFRSTAENICSKCDRGSYFIERSRYLKGENTMINYTCNNFLSCDHYKNAGNCNGCGTTATNGTSSRPISNFICDAAEYIAKNRRLNIKKAIFNAPATIVFWSDGTKTVVKCGENDEYDAEKGLAMAIAKKVLGNQGNYYNEFKKWMPEKVEEKSAKNTRWKIWFEVTKPDGDKTRCCYVNDYASKFSATRRARALFPDREDVTWVVE